MIIAPPCCSFRDVIHVDTHFPNMSFAGQLLDEFLMPRPGILCMYEVSSSFALFLEQLERKLQRFQGCGQLNRFSAPGTLQSLTLVFARPTTSRTSLAQARHSDPLVSSRYVTKIQSKPCRFLREALSFIEPQLVQNCGDFSLALPIRHTVFMTTPLLGFGSVEPQALVSTSRCNLVSARRFTLCTDDDGCDWFSVIVAMELD